MSLLSTIQLASNSLIASQIGLQVHGNNIANANTPGYIRQEVILTPAPTLQRGKLTLGLGVEVAGIVQKVDRFLADRLRNAIGDLANSNTQEQAYIELESILGELGDTDLSSSLSAFFGSINDVLNQPEDLSARNNTVLQGDALVGDIRRLDERVVELRSNANEQVVNTAAEINRLVRDVSELNRKIVPIEASSASSQAVGLRDQRELALQELASIIGTRSFESENGSVSVITGGEFLVFDNGYREVSLRETLDRGLPSAEIVVTETQAPLNVSSGSLAGLYTARDEIFVEFLDQLEDLTAALSGEFNRIYSQGQGLTGYTEITGAHSPDEVTEALDQVGLPGLTVNGSFQVQVRNTQTNTVETSDIFVQLTGLDGDTSLQDLATSLDAVDGMGAELTSSRQLRLTSDSEEMEFSFASDTSGVLAALGINVFFTGSKPGDLQVSSVLRSDSGKFAASIGGVANDAGNAEQLAGFADRALESYQGKSVTQLYEMIVAQTTQASAVRRSITEGFQTFQRTLESQHLAISGVSIDDEAVKLITQQRVYQASARVISSVADMLDTLLNL